MILVFSTISVYCPNSANSILKGLFTVIWYTGPAIYSKWWWHSASLINFHSHESHAVCVERAKSNQLSHLLGKIFRRWAAMTGWWWYNCVSKCTKPDCRADALPWVRWDNSLSDANHDHKTCKWQILWIEERESEDTHCPLKFKDKSGNFLETRLSWEHCMFKVKEWWKKIKYVHYCLSCLF